MFGIILSIIFPGLGQIYFGKYMRGILFMGFSFVPFLYLGMLIWSVVDCIKLSKEATGIDQLTTRNILAGIAVFFLVVPALSYLLFIGFSFGFHHLKNNHISPRTTKNEMVEIEAGLQRHYDYYHRYPGSLKELVGSKPLRFTWYLDSWGRHYNYLATDSFHYRLVSAGRDGEFETADDIVMSNLR